MGTVGRHRKPANRRRAAALFATATLTGGLALSATTASGTHAAAASTCGLAQAVADPTVPAITAAPKTDAWRAQYATAMRTMFGLPAAASDITAALADPNATTTDLATPLTAVESAKLAAEQAAGLTVDTVISTASSLLPTSFAGAWLSYANGGAVNVAFTDAACPSAGLLSSLSAITGIKTVAVAAATETPLSRLTSIESAFNGDSDWLTSQGILFSSASVDVPGDRFLVTLAPTSSPQSQALLQARYGASGLAFAAPAALPTTVDARTDPTGRVNGGENITDGNSRCTANISAKSSGGSYYVMTAGHCFAKGDKASQNGSASNLFDYVSSKSIGSVGSTPVHSGAVIKCDCEALGAIASSRDSHQTYVNNNALYTFDYVASSESRYDGSPSACESGVSEYMHYGQDICGKVSDASKSANINDDGAFNYTLQDAFQVKYANGAEPIPGDSGGPVGSGTTLLGLVTDNAGDSSKTKNIGTVYSGSSWIVPGH